MSSHRSLPKSVVVALTLVVAGLAFGAAAGQRTAKLDKVVPASGIEGVDLDNVDGGVEVTATNGPDIEVHAVKTARGSDPDRLLDELEIRIHVDGSRLVIETVPPRNHGIWGWFGWGGSGHTSVDYKLKVPADRELGLDTVNGEIGVGKMTASVRAESVNGSIRIDGASGHVAASTVNGSIRVARGSMADADTAVDTVNGKIEVVFPSDAAFDFELETVNGRIESDFPLQVEGEWGPKSARGEIGSGGARLTAETVNGSIRITRAGASE